MMYSNPYVKICCISSLEEAQTAIRLGASALGLVSEMPSGPGVIDDGEISIIAKTVPPPIATFLLTAKQKADEIIEQHRHCVTTTLQLVDTVALDELRNLREGLPGIKLVQVIHVHGKESLEEALDIEPYVDALLLDSGNQELEIKELGGTGRVHDWNVSARISARASVPVFLAGGLNRNNVREAIRQVEPYGLDLCSGVRTNDLLDSGKLQAFMSEVKSVRKLT